MRPSDLSPLFSDEEASPEEIRRARRIAAIYDFKEAVAMHHKLMANGEIDKLWSNASKIVGLAMELLPEE